MENYINLKNDMDYEKLKKPAEILKNGGIVVFPTDTVYGIGVNAFDENAVKKLYDAKERQSNKPICILVSNKEMIERIAKDITKFEYKLIEKFLPGPLTIILKKKDIIPDILTAHQDTIGIRIPKENIARKLIDYAGVPIATTSANISGEQSGTKLNDIIKVFKNRADFFIDGGESKLGTASTIVKVVDGVPEILRQGPITKTQIDDLKI